MTREFKQKFVGESTPGATRRNWVTQEKHTFNLLVAYDTETGDKQMHTDLPITDKELDDLYAKVRKA